MIKTSHFIAAFVGCALGMWIQAHDPDPIWHNASGVLMTPGQIVGTSFFFAALWECMLNLFRLTKGFLTGHRTE